MTQTPIYEGRASNDYCGVGVTYGDFRAAVRVRKPANEVSDDDIIDAVNTLDAYLQDHISPP